MAAEGSPEAPRTDSIAYMGKLIYGNNRHLEIDDRALAHIKVVMLTKLRRSESFAFSWENHVEAGSGRGTIWISPGVPLEFEFYGGRRPALNRSWLQLLTTLAERGDLTLVPEPEDTGQPSSAARW
jgi:hypothetical protein